MDGCSSVDKRYSYLNLTSPSQDGDEGSIVGGKRSCGIGDWDLLSKYETRFSGAIDDMCRFWILS